MRISGWIGGAALFGCSMTGNAPAPAANDSGYGYQIRCESLNKPACLEATARATCGAGNYQLLRSELIATLDGRLVLAQTFKCIKDPNERRWRV